MFNMGKKDALDFCWCRDFGHQQTVKFLEDEGHETTVKEIEEHKRTRESDMRKFFIEEKARHG